MVRLSHQVFEEEMKANKILYRGFGSQKPGGIMSNFMDIKYDMNVACKYRKACTDCLEDRGNVGAIQPNFDDSILAEKA